MCLVAAGAGYLVGCTKDDVNRCKGSTPDPICPTLCGECPADKPICDGNKEVCEPCTSSEQCAAKDATKGVCDTGSGRCVGCLRATQASDCGDKVCNNQTGSCTDKAVASVDSCGACEADDECKAGYLCVPTKFTKDEVMTDVGYFCLPRRDAAGAGLPNGSCQTNGRPYVTDSAVTSMDGDAAQMCVPALSTCPALNDFRSDTKACGGTGAQNHALCGAENLEDGYCVQFGMGMPATYRCTVPCLSVDDCPENVTSCDNAPSGIPGKVCKL